MAGKEKEEKNKIPLEAIKQIPPKLLLKMIQRAKDHLKKDETMKRVCKEYGEDISIIDFIPTYFDDLDVSATTTHGIVFLNFKLLCSGDITDIYSYLIHEWTHYLDQTCSDGPTRGASDGEYLENPHEIEGFRNQIEFIANHKGEEKAEEYVDDLLEHHEIDDKKEKKEKKDELMVLV